MIEDPEFNSGQKEKDFCVFKNFRNRLWSPSSLPLNAVKQPGIKLATNVEAKTAWSYTSTIQHNFMFW
jgi:hypothetical protein